ncbi:glycoside hydrolase family 55 protein [Aspergillus undulatus]|uniref:glycoside hydrolase family 55 protein n=1 Tax=Aspergillus undulatus TaxID=1810928 RepID=UPI003CCDA65D
MILCCQFIAILGACSLMQALASSVPFVDGLITLPKTNLHSTVSVNEHSRNLQPQLINATDVEIDEAREIVRTSIAKMAKLNKARLDKPIRDAKPGGNFTERITEDHPPLLHITDEIAQAAAVVAEADMAAKLANGSPTLVKRAAGTFWMKDIRRQGTVPWGDDPQYKVFRNVVDDYHADPTGASDSTAAIQAAINDGNRCGARCNGSTRKNAIVYFPPGTYLVSSTIEANDWPTIRAASSFVGLGVLSTNQYIGGTGPDGGDAQYYVTTARFYSQIRNLRIDITSTDPNAYVCAIHYQIAQASSLQDVELIATTGTTQQGIFSENGSGGFMSDVTFRGGNFGFYGGNQQFSAQRMTFIGCATAVQTIWDWAWVWKTLHIQGADVGFRLINDGGGGNIGSVAFIDSRFADVKTAIILAPASATPGSGTTGLILDNTRIDGPIVDTAGMQYLAAGYYNNWVLGPTYRGSSRSWTSGTSLAYPREGSLLGNRIDGLDNAPYFEREKNQYASRPIGDFVQLKSLGARGDGVTDDTAAIQRAFNEYGSGNKIIFVDAGTYILTDTVIIPKDAKIHGEAWSQFAAFGSRFSNPNQPRVMLQVGNQGDVGTVELQDLILTTKGPTAGAVLMQWNVRAASPGAAALWDVHARIGGATGTALTPQECPALRIGTNPPSCQAASLMFHLTSGASGYFENMWLWVADHMIDDPDLNDAYNDLTQLSVYVARGMLVESTFATWLYGTSSEHAVFYQYNFHRAQNIFTTMIQTEPPYYQPNPRPPAPFSSTVGVYDSDPAYSCSSGNFNGCDEAWAVIITESQNINIGSAGTYSWFSSYTQDCIDRHACQQVLWRFSNNYDNVRLQHVIAIGAEYILVSDGEGIRSVDNLAITAHPAWAQISIFDAPSHGRAPTIAG